jgi:hypothetical protein
VTPTEVAVLAGLIGLLTGVVIGIAYGSRVASRHMFEIAKQILTQLGYDLPRDGSSHRTPRWPVGRRIGRTVKIQTPVDEEHVIERIPLEVDE